MNIWLDKEENLTLLLRSIEQCWQIAKKEFMIVAYVAEYLSTGWNHTLRDNERAVSIAGQGDFCTVKSKTID